MPCEQLQMIEGVVMNCRIQREHAEGGDCRPPVKDVKEADQLPPCR